MQGPRCKVQGIGYKASSQPFDKLRASSQESEEIWDFGFRIADFEFKSKHRGDKEKKKFASSTGYLDFRI